MKRLLPLVFILATAAAQAATNFAVLVNGSGTITIGTNWHGTQVVFSASTPVYVGTNRLATLADIVAGIVTTNDIIAANTNANARLASNVWAAAASTTNYVRRTGDTITGDLSVAGTNSTKWRFAISNGTDIAPFFGHAGSLLAAGVEHSGLVGGLIVTTNPTAGNVANVMLGHVALPGQFWGVMESFGGVANLASAETTGDFWRLQFSDAVNGTTTTLARIVGDSAGTFQARIILSNAVYYGDGAGLTNLSSASSVRLTTNLLLILDSTAGDWYALRNVSGPTTNNGVSPPFIGGYATVDSRTFPVARIETGMTNTWQTRTVFSRMVEIGEVATNVAAVRIVFPGSSAAATNTISFLGPSSNVFATATLTNSTNYDLTASLFATNRRWHAQIHGWVPAAVGTNMGWLGMPRIEVIKQ